MKSITDSTKFFESRGSQEEEIFCKATKYSVYLPAERKRYYFDYFLVALDFAIMHQKNDGRALLYVISGVEHFCMPRDQYQHYLDMYNDVTRPKTGRTYLMPHGELKLNPKTKG